MGPITATLKVMGPMALYHHRWALQNTTEFEYCHMGGGGQGNRRPSRSFEDGVGVLFAEPFLRVCFQRKAPHAEFPRGTCGGSQHDKSKFAIQHGNINVSWAGEPNRAASGAKLKLMICLPVSRKLAKYSAKKFSPQPDALEAGPSSWHFAQAADEKLFPSLKMSPHTYCFKSDSTRRRRLLEFPTSVNCRTSLRLDFVQHSMRCSAKTDTLWIKSATMALAASHCVRSENIAIIKLHKRDCGEVPATRRKIGCMHLQMPSLTGRLEHAWATWLDGSRSSWGCAQAQGWKQKATQVRKKGVCNGGR